MSHPQVQQLLTNHIDLWTTSIEHKTSAGRGSNRKQLHGIKKLRELILELAVRGKLVPQDASDEPAAVLLERIAAERDRLVKEKLIKKPKVLPEIGEEEKPFELPVGWEWVRLNDIGEWGAGSTPKRGHSEYYGGEIPWFKSGELTADFISSSEETVTPTALKQTSLRFNKVGDVLIAMYGATIGKTSILEVAATTNQAVCACTPFAGIYNLFLITLLKAYRPRFVSMGAGGAQPNISREKIIATIFPLPPTQEQHRIVAKVDELMALCDQLEQQTEQQLDAHQQLVTTLLDTLTQSQNAAELAANWARLSQYFNTLFTTDASIDLLKQTILQLAVMGKLVPQDPTDEPASELLSRIAAEKEQLIKEKKIKKQKPLPAISDEEKLFELPEGWEWCRLNNLTINAEAGWSPQCEGSSRENNQWGVLKVSAVTWGEYRPEENKALPPSLEPRPQYEVKAGDFLLSRANTADLVARAVVVPESCPQHLMMSDKIIRFKLTEKIFSEFVILTNNSQVSRQYYARVAGGTSSSMKNVSQAQVRNLLIPLPPLPEQHRIVTKVNELFALCDQLKQQLQQQQRTQLLLTDTLVQDALNR